MADYFKILTSAIEQQGLEDSTARQALYDRVRKVLDTQLEGLDPVKSGPIAERHRKTLDDAIAKIEAASVDIVSGEAPKIEPTLSDQKSVDRPIPPSVADAEPSNDPGNDAAPAPATDTEPVSDPQPSPAGAYVAPPQTARPTEPSMPRAGSNPADQSGRYLRPPSTSERMAADAGSNRSGARTFFMMFIIFVVAIAGLGYWQRDNLDAYAGPVVRVVGEYTAIAKDKIGEMTGLWAVSSSSPADEGSQEEEQINGNASAPEPEPASLSGDTTASQSPEADGVDDAGAPANEAPANNAPVQVAAAPPEVPEVDAPQVTIVEPSEPIAPTAGPSEEEAPPTTVVENQTTPVATGPALPSVFMLLEGDADEGRPDDRIVGSATWSFAIDAKLLRIEAQMSELGSKLVIDIAQNDDPELPATHTVTYIYTPPEAQPDGPITNFPSLMTRVDDTSASVPLRGVGAPIIPNQYLMGLSDKPEDRVYNQGLLETAEWIVVPVLFETGRRGLFLIEVGEAGREALTAAQAAWGDSGE